jgi:hypothetical protein
LATNLIKSGYHISKASGGYFCTSVKEVLEIFCSFYQVLEVTSAGHTLNPGLSIGSTPTWPKSSSSTIRTST